MFGFPNAEGESLKTTVGTTYQEGKCALSFVQRTVVQIQYGGSRGSTSATPDNSAMRCSVEVILRDDTQSSPFIDMGLSISRDGG